MGCVQGIGKLDGIVQYLFGRKRLSGDRVLESLPFEQFHGNERLALLVANFVDGADARMIESRCGPGLALEPLQHLSLSRRNSAAET